MQNRDRDRKPQQDEDDDRITASGTREDTSRPTAAGTGRKMDEDIDEESEPLSRKRTSTPGGDTSPTTRKK